MDQSFVSGRNRRSGENKKATRMDDLSRELVIRYTTLFVQSSTFQTSLTQSS